MICPRCQHPTSEDEHRCEHCGRRLGDTLPVFQAGSTALAVETAPPHLQVAPKVKASVPAPDFRHARQQSLFFDEAAKVIEFPAPLATPRLAEPRRAPRRVVRAPDPAQATLDFSLPQPNTPRVLDTQVEASIECDFRIASITHRLCATAVDLGVIVLGVAFFGAPFVAIGGKVEWTPLTITLACASVALIAIAYGLVWAVAGGETPGRRLTGLRLIDFDGQPIEWPQRVARVAGACVSVFAAGAGLLWALVDEEQLSWHDHMTKSFPTAAD